MLDNSEVFTAAGLAGLGMLQGMRFFLQPYIDSGQLVEVLPDFPAPRRPLSLLYPHRHLSHKVQGLCRLAAGAGSDPGLTIGAVALTLSAERLYIKCECY